MKKILKQHQFWACVALVGMVMAIITGHKLIGGGKDKEQE